jgi:hypothetical protein
MAAWSRRAPGEVWRICHLHNWRVAWALSVAISGCGLAHGSHALGGADTYGYVSQADLWLRGNLEIDQSFAKEAPWPRAALSFAPLGYTPHPLNDRVIVPTYSPGLPVLLAIAKLLGGQDAMFCVVPLCAGLLVLATYGLGRRLGAGGAVGLTGAWLVATSPVVLAYTMTSMTDVPVAAVWAAAVYLLLGTSASSAAGAGLLSSVAILIRPNLAPLAAVLGLQYVFRMRDTEGRHRAFRDLLVFGMAVLPGALAVAAINQHLFGSPFVSGYGRLANLFSWTRMATNLRLYLEWLVDAHTPVVLCGLAAIFFPLRRLWPGTRDRTVFIVVGLFVITLWAIYCGWLVFESWWFSRFMLSSYPFIMLGVGAVAAALFRSALPFIKPGVACSVIALGILQLHFAAGLNVFGLGRGERRNISVAQLARRVTESNSVILSYIHSGSVRYYGGRMTMTYMWLDEKWLDGAVEWLNAHGVHTYALLEPWEMPRFRQQFAGARRLAALERPPIAIYDVGAKLMIFDLSEPGARSSQPEVVTDIDTGWSAVPPAPPPQLVFRRVP